METDEKGTPMAVVQSVIGHGSPAMTSHYTHIGENAAIAAAHAFDGQIAPWPNSTANNPTSTHQHLHVSAPPACHPASL
jgi:hypothetical protein